MTLTLSIAAALLLALLFVPIFVELRLGERGLCATARWGSRPSPRCAAAPSATDESIGGKRRKSHRRATANGRKLRALLTSADFLASLARLGRRVLNQLRPRHLVLSLRLGLGDPADTGRAVGALSPLLLALTQVQGAQINFEPDFLRRTFDVRAHALVRIVPVVLLALIVGYFLTRPPWRALLRYARA